MPSASGRPTSLQVGAILSLSGSGASYGTPARDAILLRAQEYNTAHNEKKVNVVFEDSRFDPAEALSAYKSLQARGVHHFISNGSSVAVALATPVVQSNDFLFEVAAVTPLYSDGKKNTCRLALTADVAGEKIGQFLMRDRQVHSVAFLTLNDEYGTSMQKNILKSIEKNNVSTHEVETFGKDETNFQTVVSKIIAKQKEIDALVVIPAAGQAEGIFRNLQELGWTKKIYSDNWTIVNNNLKNRSLVEGVFFSNYDWEGTAKNNDQELQKRFKEAFEKKFGYEPPVVAANAYDAFSLILDSYDQHHVSPEEMSQWIIHQKNRKGVTGVIEFNDDCESKRDVLLQQVKNGEFISVSW